MTSPIACATPVSQLLWSNRWRQSGRLFGFPATFGVNPTVPAGAPNVRGAGTAAPLSGMAGPLIWS
jgi:hypothetical protein